MNLAAYAAIGSGIFWFLFLGLVLVEYTERIPYSAAFKALGISTGVLQALPILIPAAVLYEAFGDGAHALNVAGFIAACASAIIISMSTLKYLKKGTRLERTYQTLCRPGTGFSVSGSWLFLLFVEKLRFCPHMSTLSE